MKAHCFSVFLCEREEKAAACISADRLNGRDDSQADFSAPAAVALIHSQFFFLFFFPEDDTSAVYRRYYFSQLVCELLLHLHRFALDAVSPVPQFVCHAAVVPTREYRPYSSFSVSPILLAHYPECVTAVSMAMEHLLILRDLLLPAAVLFLYPCRFRLPLPHSPG